MNATPAPDTPLWQPNPQHITQTRIADFMRYIAAHGGPQCADYAALYEWSICAPQDFWVAVWDFCDIIATQRGETVISDPEQMPGARWFPDARLNYAENLLRPNHPRIKDSEPAIIFWGEHQVKQTLTIKDLRGAVSQFTQALRARGIQPGDRVAGYLPNLPETVIAMLAATSLGAVWSSCSPDFGVQGVVDRFSQIAPRILIASDGYFYNRQTISNLARLQQIMAQLPSVEQLVIVPYIDTDHLNQQSIQEVLPETLIWADVLAPFSPQTLEFAALPFDHPLFIMYSSGTTGAPKCIVHSAGGTLLQHLKEHVLHTNISAGDRLFYFTTCGWMMWNWLVSGLASGATLLLYDGSPFLAKGQILWDFAAQTQCNIFGTSAKYLDAIAKLNLQPQTSHDLSALRAILSTGSPLAPESFDYVYRAIKSDLQLASISGGTDIISCFALGCPILPVWRGELQCRGLGMPVEVWDDSGQPITSGKGELVCIAPFPSMPIGFWNDPDQSKYRAAYFERFPGVWHHGDYVEPTVHNGLVIHGRSDAVLNPGGVRIGTAEIYRQVEQLPEVLESIAIGQQWPIQQPKDVRIILFVRLREGLTLDKALSDQIKAQIKDHTTPRHVPEHIVQVADIPRTKSGKIVELAVRNVVHGESVKNLEALANPEALAYFRDIALLQK